MDNHNEDIATNSTNSTNDLSNDYTDEAKMVDIINAFQIYYKKLFNKKDNENMFSDLDISNPLATNRSMEFLYDHIFKYHEYQKVNNLLLLNEDDNFNLDDYDEFFALLFNGEIQKLSASLYSLMEYLVTYKETWYELKWEIMNLKNN